MNTLLSELETLIKQGSSGQIYKPRSDAERSEPEGAGLACAATPLPILFHFFNACLLWYLFCLLFIVVSCAALSGVFTPEGWDTLVLLIISM